jgi:hypothetical protein
MSTVIKPLANTINIGSTANNMNGATILKVVNSSTSTYATLVFKYANTQQYADLPVAPLESLIVMKGADDVVVGTGMYAAAIAWPKG